MKLTNKFNLPQTFMNVLDRPTYSKGKAHLSATELINSPRIVQLRKKYDEQITSDVSEMIWSIFGTAIHSVLEQGKDDNHLVEERIHAELDGWHISGAIDLQRIVEDGVEISDYKTVGVWSVMNEKVEWEEQLNIYAWLVERVKRTPVVKLNIVAIVRDWNRRDAGTRQGYPEAPVAVLDIQLWSMEKREEFIRSRIHEHSEALFATETEEELPLCTPSQMWEKPTMYAVKKEGAARAKSVHAELDEAEVALEKAGKGYQLEIRQGDRTRCSTFCPVAQWCNQYQDYLKEKVNV
jgi:hypothetical protein